MWGHHVFIFFPFGIFFLLIIGGFVFRMVMFRRYGRRFRPGGWQEDAEMIVRRRFANGEIDEEEYRKRLETLKK